MKRACPLLLLAVLLPLLLSTAANAAPLTVFAAASLQEGLEAVAAAFEAGHGGEVRVSYASSPSLAREIEQGATPDLFISDDEEWMNYLHVRNRIDAASRHVLLGNRLVLIAAAESTAPAVVFDTGAPLPRPLPLAADGRLALALVEFVPAGRHARAALRRLQLWESVKPRVIEAENVRAAMQRVVIGEAQLGIVYATDAAVERRVRVLGAIPPDSHPPIRYPVARLQSSRHAQAAALLAFLQGNEASRLFRDHGFIVEN